MTKRKIVLTANEKTGEIKTETVGFKGKGCVNAASFLEKGLGGGLLTKTKEYHEYEEKHDHVVQREV